MRAAATLLLVFGIVAACGARTPLELGDVRNGDDDGGTPPVVDGASPDSALPPNKPTRVGYVAAIGTGDQEGAFAVARFYPQLVDPACAYLGAIGTCSVVTCFSSADAPPSDDAGIISTKLGPTTFGPLIDYMGVSPTGTYQTATFATDVAVGTSVDFIGDGAFDVPAFDVSVTMPAFGMLTSPVLQISTTVDSSHDLPLAWDPIESADAVFALSPPTSLNTSPTLVCFFDGASGAGVVPHAQLAAIKQVSPAGEVQASFLAMARASTVAGDWTVSAIAITGTGISQQSGTITLE